MTAKEMLEITYPYASEPFVFTVDELIELITDFAGSKCEEQRKLCADNAEMKIYVEMQNPSFGYRLEIDRESIINAPEPKM